MTTDKNTTTSAPKGRKQFWLMAALLFAALAILFFRSFLPGIIHFNNDTPLGFMKPLVEHGLSGSFGVGRWNDRNSLGLPIGTPLISISNTVLYGLGAVGFAKFYAPIALFVLGLGAWTFFRALKLSPVACLLGGLVAALNTPFFATACWGVAAQPIAFGLCYLALAAVVSNSGPVWARLGLAGFAVGMGVMEAADIGAIFSIFVALFVMYHALASERSPQTAAGQNASGASPLPPAARPHRSLGRRMALGALQVTVIALCAGWMAFGSVRELVGTQIQGVAGMAETPEAKAARWDWATQWSTPKLEILGMAIPGLFGYRMDSSQHGIKGGDYWGRGGRDPAWDRYFANGAQGPEPGGFIRYGGGGGYFGVLTVLVVIWAAVQAFRKQDSVFSLPKRKFLWFWLGIMAFTLLMSFGRFAPFYWFLYQLPYFSTIRNPSKFGHVFSWALVVVFAYGIDGLWRSYVQTPIEAERSKSGARAAAPASAGLGAYLANWWSKVRGFDRIWTLGCLVALGVCVLGWGLYAASRGSLESYLQTVRFDPDNARAIAGFSIEHVGWFVLRLVISLLLLTLVISRWFTAARAPWAGLLLGLFLFGDLAVANQPWLIFWNYKEKYATNPIIDQLRDHRYEHRVAGLPRLFMDPSFLQQLQVDSRLAAEEQYFRQLYGIEWTQQLFQFYNIQCLDIVQMPRVPADLEAYQRAFVQARSLQEYFRLTGRQWQLTNTRYLLGAAGWLDLLNQGMDPQQHRFRIVTRFTIEPKPGIVQPTQLEDLTATPSTNGQWALFEYGAALPRAKLYPHWQVGTNDTAILEQLVAESFDPAQTVLVSATPGALTLKTNTADPATSNSTGAVVQYVSYSSRDIQFKTQAVAPTILLLNDKFDPDWKVTVDGKPEPLLRCNFLMRGVQVPAGEHHVEFRYTPPNPGFYVCLSAFSAALVLIASLFFLKTVEPASEPADRPADAKPLLKQAS